MAGYPPPQNRDSYMERGQLRDDSVSYDRTLPPLKSIIGSPSQLDASQPRPNGLQQNAPVFQPPPPRFERILNPQNSAHQATRYPPPIAPSPTPFAQLASPPSRELSYLDTGSGTRPSPASNATHSALSQPSSRSGFPTPQSQLTSPPSTGHHYEQQVSRPTSLAVEPVSNRSSGQVSTESAPRNDATNRSSRPNSTRTVQYTELIGDGEYYVLADGTRMRASIAGERVNPQWGITKAGKPRKRLAKACITCREKKIKCEQGDTGQDKCGQCHRLGKECKIPDDSRATPEPEQRSRTPNLKDRALADERNTASGTQEAKQKKRNRNTLASVINADHEHNPDGSRPEYRNIIAPLPHAAERGQRYFQDLHETSGPVPAKRKSKKPASGRIFRGPKPPTAEVDPERFDPYMDPYACDAEVTIYYLELYFYYRASGPYEAVPREHFLEWVKNGEPKSVDDRMAIYAMMALGSCFGADKELKQAGRPIYEIAFRLERERTTAFTLQLVHARSALVLYHFAVGEFESAYEYTANAVRAATMLRYQDEYHIKENIDEDVELHEYNMRIDMLKECRRRTFWVVYLFDRYNSFSYGSMGLIHDVEVFLRLPCRNQEFVDGLNPAKVPHFHGDSVREAHTTEPGSMALLVDVASIWGDVTGNAYKAINRSSVVYRNYYIRYFDQTRDRMQSWVNSLPDRLRMTPENTIQAIRGGYFSKYYVLHGVFCLIGMKLGRIGRCDLLDDDIKRRNLKVSMFYARRWLAIVSQLSKAIWEYPGKDIDFALVQPFPGYSITNAVDILSSGGHTDRLASLTNKELEDCKTVVTQGSNYWIINGKQRKFIDDRQGLLSAHSMRGGEDTSEKLRIPDAIDRSFLPSTHDIVYGVSDELFYDVVLDRETGFVDPLEIK